MYDTNITPNWMSTVNLAGYKLTLYLVKKQLWNAPEPLVNDSGPLQRNECIIIAETGAEAVFSIDDVNMTTYIRGGQQNVDGAAGVLQFRLHEVLGFNFLDKILQLSGVFGFTTLNSANYVLKIEFMGRDPGTDLRQTYENIFLYSLKFSEIQASVGVQGTVYDIIATNMQREAQYHSSVYTNVHVTGFNTVNEYLAAVQRACNEYEEKMSTQDQSNPQPRKTWEIKLGDRLSAVQGKIDTGDSWMEKHGASMDLGRTPMQGTGDVGVASKMTQNDEGSRDQVINASTNIASMLERMLTANSRAFQDFAERQREKGPGATPIIKARTEMIELDRIDPRTNTSEIKIVITLELYEDSTQVSRNAEQQRTHQQVRKNQEAFLETHAPQIVKKYHWIYTGQNTEVTGFDLAVNNAFFVSQDPNFGRFYPTGQGVKVPSQPTRSSIIPKQNRVFLSQTEPQQPPPIIESVAFGDESVGITAQHTNEEVENSSANTVTEEANHARREEDFLNATFEVKGDPFWLGSGTTIAGTAVKLSQYQQSSVMVAFLTYKPEESVAYTEDQKRGLLDCAASGLYEIYKVDQKLSSGEFSQTLHGLRQRNFTTALMQHELEQM